MRHQNSTVTRRSHTTAESHIVYDEFGVNMYEHLFYHCTWSGNFQFLSSDMRRHCCWSPEETVRQILSDRRSRGTNRVPGEVPTAGESMSTEAHVWILLTSMTDLRTD
jgi:hypothetical protein